MTKQTNRKPGATAAASAIAPDAYTRITNRVVADLEQGVRPWCKPWGGDQLGARITRPRRANGKPYSDIAGAAGSSAQPATICDHVRVSVRDTAGRGVYRVRLPRRQRRCGDPATRQRRLRI